MIKPNPLLATKMNAIEKTIDEQQERYFPLIEKILNKNSHLFTAFNQATPQQDQEEGFDAVFTFSDVKIPIRIRGYYYLKKFRDITIRSRSRNGGKTEIHKVLEGCGDYYFYCWETEDKRSIAAYVIFDMNRFVSSGIAKEPDQRHIPNNDGTYFHSYDMERLIKEDALLIYEYLVKNKININ